MTALQAAQVDRITARAQQADAGKALAAVIGGTLFLLGWLAFKAFRVLWFAAAWSWFAVAEGWSSARRDARGPGRAR